MSAAWGRPDGVAGRSVLAQRGAHARRILVFTHGYPPRQTSGAETHIQRKVRWWRARGYVVEVVAADPSPAAEMRFGVLEVDADWVDGVRVYRLRFAAPDASRPLAETFQHPLLALVVEERIRAFQPDLVYQVSGYLFGVAPVRVAAAAGVPVVLFMTDYWHECQRVTLLRSDGACCVGPRSPADCAACRVTDRQLARLGGARLTGDLWRVAAWAGNTRLPLVAGALGVTAFQERERAVTEALATVDLAIANSAFLARRLRNLGVPAERMLVVRQGIDADEFARTPPKRARDWDELRVLYLGQLTRHKGVDLLVEAVELLTEEGIPIQLSLHGPMTEAGFSDELHHLQHPSITVGESLSRDRIAAALAAHDVLVVPSRWYENSPNVILEAFSAGVPVITANHGGMAEMVHHQLDGVMFEPSDVGSLATVLRSVARQPELLDQLRAGVSTPHGIDVEMEAEEQAVQAMLARRAAASAPTRERVARVVGAASS